MATCPRRYVAAPAGTPYRHGLFSVAQFPPSPDHVECGVEWEPDFCGKAATTHDPCNAGVVTPQPDKALERGIELVQADPFTVYAGFECSVIGTSMEAIQERAERSLALGEQRAVEFAFWTGIEGNRPRLADSEAVIVGDGLSPKMALAALEDFLGREYPGIGTIHASRGMAALWHDHLRLDGDVLRSHLDTRFAFGGGYSAAATGPDGTPAPPGSAWVYATGQVSIWRSDTWVNPQPIQQALDLRSNMVGLVAERTYVVGYPCVLAAARVDLTCCPC